MKSRNSVEKRIISRLKGFVAAIKNDENILEKMTCRTIALDLQPVPYDPKSVTDTRKLLGVSQTVFALFLGVSPKTVRSWEQGINVPKDMACRFMDEIRRDPAHWKKRLSEAIVVKETIGK